MHHRERRRQFIGAWSAAYASVRFFTFLGARVLCVQTLSGRHNVCGKVGVFHRITYRDAGALMLQRRNTGSYTAKLVTTEAKPKTCAAANQQNAAYLAAVCEGNFTQRKPR